MAKDPAFLFYSGDFLTGVTGMNMEERGQYITLLCLQHAKGHLSLELMNRSVPGLSAYVLEKFQQDEEGFYFNKRLEEEAIKRNKFCDSRRNNRIKKDKDEEHMINICETSVLHMENENVSIDISNLNNKGVVEKKPNLPAKTATWNNIKIGTKVPKRDHHVMAWDDFLKYQENHDRRSCEKINAPLVFLSDREYKALRDKYKSEQIVKAMIMVMNNWKAKTKFAHQKNLNDYLCIDDAWVLEKAEKELRIINSQTVENLRKREKVAEEIRNSNQGITYYEPEPKQQPTE